MDSLVTHGPWSSPGAADLASNGEGEGTACKAAANQWAEPVRSR
eukprot:CAMPEP_0181217322 /NCGR_PEP_ID=MMETSP1096-20121128/27084_1 /TAXON_ID=156174 ORGANISM="Chrysochromulina ericina, Strain CCMP281" /NCGR_SAMPLE_ID=MMETSP1096 /ASSEMBLY_ACC=CAM_ASM_000453 /LENGTH=43 /DNA_ID= /DNA_START= /DNA_END= /DNA_ORIENTATION=